MSYIHKYIRKRQYQTLKKMFSSLLLLVYGQSKRVPTRQQTCCAVAFKNALKIIIVFTFIKVAYFLVRLQQHSRLDTTPSQDLRHVYQLSRAKYTIKRKINKFETLRNALGFSFQFQFQMNMSHIFDMTLMFEDCIRAWKRFLALGVTYFVLL